MKNLMDGRADCNRPAAGADRRTAEGEAGLADASRVLWPALRVRMKPRHGDSPNRQLEAQAQRARR